MARNSMIEPDFSNEPELNDRARIFQMTQISKIESYFSNEPELNDRAGFFQVVWKMDWFVQNFLQASPDALNVSANFDT